MASKYSEARKLIIEQIIDQSFYSFNINFFRDFKAANPNISNDLIQQVCHDLYLDRIIVPGKIDESTTNELNWPNFRFTEFGRSIIAQEEYDPGDPEGYSERLQTNIPLIDETILVYLAESLNCLRLNFYLASAVMLGCAGEKAMLLLIECYGKSISDPGKRQQFKNKISTKRTINAKYEELSKKLKAIKSELPSELTEEMDTQLDQIFNLIRKTRNDAGHPTGTNVERETMVGNLILFPIYCKKLYSLIEYLKNNKV